MGRLNGLVGGFVLTTSVIYLTARQHQEKSRASSQSLKDATQSLELILRPPPPPKPRTEYVETRPDLIETMKDGWNSEVEGIVRWIQNANPTRIFDNLEDVAKNAFSGLRQLNTDVIKPEK